MFNTERHIIKEFYVFWMIVRIKNGDLSSNLTQKIEEWTLLTCKTLLQRVLVTNILTITTFNYRFELNWPHVWHLLSSLLIPVPSFKAARVSVQIDTCGVSLQFSLFLEHHIGCLLGCMTENTFLNISHTERVIDLSSNLVLEYVVQNKREGFVNSWSPRAWFSGFFLRFITRAFQDQSKGHF